MVEEINEAQKELEALAPKEQAHFEAIDKFDESLIIKSSGELIEELRDDVRKTFFYSFKHQGRQVTDISALGVSEIAQRCGFRIKALGTEWRLCRGGSEATHTPDYFDAVVVGVSQRNGAEAIGGASFLLRVRLRRKWMFLSASNPATEEIMKRKATFKEEKALLDGGFSTEQATSIAVALIT